MSGQGRRPSAVINVSGWEFREDRERRGRGEERGERATGGKEGKETRDAGGSWVLRRDVSRRGMP